MAEQQGTSNTTTPSSKKTRGRLPVITLPAVTETGEANILLRAPTTFAVAIGFLCGRGCRFYERLR